MKKGVTFIGTLLVDFIKMIDCYPPAGNLCNMGEISKCVGGLAANTPIDLKILDPSLHVAVMGMVGNDESGKFITKKIESYGIDVSGISVHNDLPTSFTDVMTEKQTGVRTFFQQQGACAEYGYDEIDFTKIDTKIAHVGYALLMNKMDSFDKDFGTVMGKVLKTIKEKGIETSMDLVTETSNRYQSVIIPSLPYVDHLFMNEVEASHTTGINLVNLHEDVVNEKTKEACEFLFNRGVQKTVIIHSEKGGWIMKKDKSFYNKKSFKLPKDYIKGTVGAGDAFCAGMLYSIINDIEPLKALEISNLAAVANLSNSNSIDGMKSLDELLKLDFK